MALLPILTAPDPRLKKKSLPVDTVDAGVRQLMDDMLETMYDEPGIGLAAPQVGAAVRLIVVDTTWTEEGAERNPLVLVNPEIVSKEGTITWNEGCLSVPDYQADVERAARVRLRATDLDGKVVEIAAQDLQAVCFQHEIDHLDGILFIDRISRLKRSLYVQKRKKQIRREADEGGSPHDPRVEL